MPAQAVHYTHFTLIPGPHPELDELSVHLYFLWHFAWGRKKRSEDLGEPSAVSESVRPRVSHPDAPRGSQVFFDPNAAHIVEMQMQNQGAGTISDVFGPEFASRSFFGSVAAPSNASLAERDEDRDEDM